MVVAATSESIAKTATASNTLGLMMEEYFIIIWRQPAAKTADRSVDYRRSRELESVQRVFVAKQRCFSGTIYFINVPVLRQYFFGEIENPWGQDRSTPRGEFSTRAFLQLRSKRIVVFVGKAISSL